MVGFNVYIDEAGDEGFVFNQPGKGSSRWFVLSAAITRADTDLQTVKLVDAVRSDLRSQPRTTLHFRKLKHEHRLPYVARIASARLRVASVLIHKPSIQDAETFVSTPHLLYRYATRILLERVSWICRDHRRAPDHHARIYFSNRSCMSYEALYQYLDHLREQSGDLGVKIDWSVINRQQVYARTHDSLMGLQIADAIASSFYFGFELSPQGFNEPRYATMLRPVVYRHQHRYMGHGIKLWPPDAGSQLLAPHLAWVTDTFAQ